MVDGALCEWKAFPAVVLGHGDGTVGTDDVWVYASEARVAVLRYAMRPPRSLFACLLDSVKWQAAAVTCSTNCETE